MAAFNRVGQLYTYGDGHFGCLGHGNAIKRTAVTPVLALQGTRVVDVSCGDKFTVVVTQRPFSNLKKIVTLGRIKKWNEKNEWYRKYLLSVGYKESNVDS